MQSDVLSELRKRISDPVELAKFERFHRLYDRRMERLGQAAGPMVMLAATMKCWRKAFGAEWPRTKPSATPSTTGAETMKPENKAAAKLTNAESARRLKAALDAREVSSAQPPSLAQHQRASVQTRG